MNEKIEFIQAMIHMAEEHDLSELSVDFKGIKVALRKNQPTVAPMQMMIPSVSAPANAAPVSAEPAAKAEEKIPSNLIPVKSPLSGVFYKTPKPTSPPFVNIGDKVEKDQVLCIVEAMKIMNEITSEVKGRVARVVLENGKVANEGDVLLYLEPIE
ncbi:MAG: acetyl-CoA carboxylase, biotin carboxyl carrier protein [Firmicutes bacterium]|nr:acetyl-CoA carboxylase, biotin carboxyl carrier protein [Bacillota bacterium]